MNILIKIKKITVESNHLEIFFNNRSKKRFTFEDLDKIFITVEKQNYYIYYTLLLIGIAVIASLYSIVSLFTTMTLSLLVVLSTSIAWHFSRNYQLVIRLKSKVNYRYSVTYDKRYTILEKVRITRAKLHELNFTQPKKLGSHD